MTEAQMRRAIARKRDGEVLDAQTYDEVVAGSLSGAIADDQCAAFLMACLWRGLDFAETHALTAAFVASGETLAAPDPPTVDKHSSGGVADTASLIVVPLVAACGVPVAKLSGRALGHTGGTLDKLEAIPGVRTDLEPGRFFEIVRATGCAVAAQSARLVPADKKFYALRDRTATVPSPGLIAASIVSKKIAGGAHAIVYDVKVGRGAFVRDVSAGRELARILVRLTEAFGKRSRALVTAMEEPLGPAIGTGLEAIEARDFLSGKRRDARLAVVCRELGLVLLDVGGVRGSRGELAGALDDALGSGRAAAVFAAMLAAQGACPGALADLSPAAEGEAALAPSDGYVAAIDPVALGELARDLVAAVGAGAGIRLAARVGDRVRAGEPLARIYGGDARATATARTAFRLTATDAAAGPLLYGESDAVSEVEPLPAATFGGTSACRSTLERK